MIQELNAINPFNGMLGQQGWICPKCGRVFSPSTPLCVYIVAKKLLPPQVLTFKNILTLPISYHLRIWVKLVENTLEKKVILVISATAMQMKSNLNKHEKDLLSASDCDDIRRKLTDRIIQEL